MVVCPVMSMTSRSIPIPIPDVGGMPYSSPDKVIVDRHGFVVSFFGEAELFFETQPLVDGVVQLGVGITEFFPVYH